MIQGRGYSLAINELTTGTVDDAYLVSIVAGTDKPVAIGAVQGHFTNGDSAENVSFGLKRASAATPGAAITARPMNTDDTAVGFTASTSPTGVTFNPTEPLAVFGGNGAANFGWYSSFEEHQIILKPAEILVLQLIVAPTSALTMQATINVTEL